MWWLPVALNALTAVKPKLLLNVKLLSAVCVCAAAAVFLPRFKAR
jgi:hypothetical protein